MEIELLNKISSSSINGYYEPSLEKVVVWFHKDTTDNDMVAYLQNDMSWDLREVIDEKASLYDDKEIIEVSHKRLDTFAKDSKFDITIRKMLNQLIEHSEKAGNLSYGLGMMKIILNVNDYNKVKN